MEGAVVVQVVVAGATVELAVVEEEAVVQVDLAAVGTVH